MAIKAIVRGAGREDVYDYPVEALREAVVNALMHRDYGPDARGAQVQVEMFQDRLVIRNPGGLYGAVTEDDLGEEGLSSSRNSALATLLQDVYIPGTDRLACVFRGIGPPSPAETDPPVRSIGPRRGSRGRRVRMVCPVAASCVK
jgi:ATP-dependent DNA helicase RecG